MNNQTCPWKPGLTRIPKQSLIAWQNTLSHRSQRQVIRVLLGLLDQNQPMPPLLQLARLVKLSPQVVTRVLNELGIEPEPENEEEDEREIA